MIVRNSVELSASRASSRIFREAVTLISVGTGCPASIRRILCSGSVCPSFTLTTPSVIRSPRISSSARAIGAPAFPAPMTTIREKLSRSSESWTVSVSILSIVPSSDMTL